MAKWSVEYPHLDSEQKDFLNNKLTDNRNHWIKGFLARVSPLYSNMQ